MSAVSQFLSAATLVAMSGLASLAHADVLEEIAARGEIRLGHRTDAPPLSYTAHDGEPAGLAVALCREVATRIARRIEMPDLTVTFVPVTAASRFEALHEDRTDLHCGPASATLERRETLDFSVIYFVDGAVSVVRAGTFATVFDVDGGDIGVNTGTTTVRMVRDLMTRNGIGDNLRPFSGHVAGLKALADGEIAAYFGDSAIMRFQLRELELTSRLSILPEEFSFEPYALAMKRGEAALRLEVDRALSEIYDSGLIYNIVRDQLGDFRLTPLNRAVYQIMGLPG